MIPLWVLLSLAAGSLQASRNALARSLTGQASPALISWARFAFNLPFSAALAGVLTLRADSVVITGPFLLACLATALSQLLGNVALVAAFRRTSFAASIVLHKLEVAMAAIVGLMLFAERPSALGWGGIVLCAAGMLVMNLGRDETGSRLRRMLRLDTGSLLSLLCGLLLVAASFALKEANELFAAANPRIGTDRFEAAAQTLFHTTWMEVAILSVWLLARERGELARVRVLWSRMLAIGATGFAGSLCWFWAYSLTLVAYVKAVGQIEAVIAVLLALFVFRERGVVKQLPGVAVVLVGIVLVLLG